MFGLPSSLGIRHTGFGPVFIGESLSTLPATNVDTHSILIPAGAVAGDVLILAVASESSTASTESAPSGWSLLQNDANSTGFYGFNLFMRVMQAGDTSATFNISSGGGACMWAFRGLSGTKVAGTGYSQNGTADPSQNVSTGKLRIGVLMGDGVWADSGTAQNAVLTVSASTGIVRPMLTIGTSSTGFSFQLAYFITPENEATVTTFEQVLTYNTGNYGIALISAGVN